MGVTWSVSQLGPSLSAPPHQSSSLLYSCSKLSNTLHTCWEKRAVSCVCVDCRGDGKANSSLIPVQRSCRRRQRHWQAWVGPPSSAWAVASVKPRSRHSLWSGPCRSGWPEAEPPLSAEPAGHSGVFSAERGKIRITVSQRRGEIWLQTGWWDNTNSVTSIACWNCSCSLCSCSASCRELAVIRPAFSIDSPLRIQPRTCKRDRESFFLTELADFLVFWRLNLFNLQMVPCCRYVTRHFTCLTSACRCLSWTHCSRCLRCCSAAKSSSCCFSWRNSSKSWTRVAMSTSRSHSSSTPGWKTRNRIRLGVEEQVK